MLKQLYYYKTIRFLLFICNFWLRNLAIKLIRQFFVKFTINLDVKTLYNIFLALDLQLR